MPPVPDYPPRPSPQKGSHPAGFSSPPVACRPPSPWRSGRCFDSPPSPAILPPAPDGAFVVLTPAGCLPPGQSRMTSTPSVILPPSTVPTPTHAPPPYRNLVIELTVRWKWAFFMLVAVLQFSAWNGYWRMSRDSALYRGVAQNLAKGKGYTFRGDTERHAFPGLPLLLAGIDRVFPSKNPLEPKQALLTIFAMGLATLLIIYRLIRLHFDEWLAVAVTCGVGVNR